MAHGTQAAGGKARALGWQVTTIRSGPNTLHAAASELVNLRHYAGVAVMLRRCRSAVAPVRSPQAKW
jgi:hypothetical protein